MTRSCTCPGSLASSLESSRKRNKLAEAFCGGRFVVNGIGPISRSMLGTVGLEVTSSINPEFNWKTVTKGKRSRKAVARCMNRGVVLANKSPKRVGDFSGSDSDKFGEAGNGQCFPGKVEYVPLKKRRHYLRSPSPSSRPPLYGCESVSPQLLTPSSHSEDLEHLSDHNGSSGSYTNRFADRTGSGVDVGVAGYKVSDLTRGVLYNSDNFSGIALLAAAAGIDTIDDETDNDKVDAMEASSAPQRSDDASTSSLPKRESINHSDLGKQMHKQLSRLENKGCSFVATSHSSDESDGLMAAKSVSLKVDRLHWDLNTSMDAWEQPNEDASNAEEYNCKFASSDGMQIVKLDKGGCTIKRVSRSNENDAESCLPLGQNENALECSISKLEENELEEFCCQDRFGIKETSPSNINGNSRGPLNFCSADTKLSGNVLSSNEFIDNSPQAESCHSSEVSVGYLDKKSDCRAIAQVEDSCRKAITSTLANPSKHVVALQDSSDFKKFGFENVARTEFAEDSQKILELPSERTSLLEEMCIGTCKTLDVDNSESVLVENSQASSKYESLTASDISMGGQSTGSRDTKGQDVKVLAAKTLEIDVGEHLVSKEILSKHEDSHISNGEADGISILRDSGKDFVLDDRHNSDVSQDDHGRTDARGNMAELEVGYDSPYEDGELRGSVLYSWEGNEFEDGERECLDYESDGRDGEDSDAGDFPDSKIMEADYEGTEKKSLSAIPVRGTDCMKSSSVRSSLRRELEEENAEKTEATGKKALNQGSGTTEELSSNVIVERNDGSVRRHHTYDHMDVLNVKRSSVGEIGLKTTRGKLQSRIEGPLSLDEMERNAACSRSRNIGGSYSRAERDDSLDRFMTGYKSAILNRERNGGDSECVYWDSRNRYPSSYRGPVGRGPTRQRNAIANAVDKLGGVSSREQKQSINYSSRTERDSSPDRSASRYRSAVQEHERNGVDSQLVYWDPRMRYASSYRGPEGHVQTRPRGAISESVDKFGGLNSYDRKQSINYSSKSMQRPRGWRRSPIDRDDYHDGPSRVTGFRNNRNRGGSRNFSDGVGRGFREEYHQPTNHDDASSTRMPHYLSWRDRSLFPPTTRGAHVSAPRRSSRSRSRTRSPRAWQAQRERNLGTRHHSRSPDFKSRMERMRPPFQKAGFGADYGDSFVSPPRGRFSLQQNYRVADDRSFVDSHLRQRRSPLNVFRQSQRLDSVGLSGRSKINDSFRPMMRPGRFPPVAGVGRGCNLEDTNEDKGHDDRSGIMH